MEAEVSLQPCWMCASVSGRVAASAWSAGLGGRFLWQSLTSCAGWGWGGCHCGLRPWLRARWAETRLWCAGLGHASCWLGEVPAGLGLGRALVRGGSHALVLVGAYHAQWGCAVWVSGQGAVTGLWEDLFSLCIISTTPHACQAGPDLSPLYSIGSTPQWDQSSSAPQSVWSWLLNP